MKDLAFVEEPTEQPPTYHALRDYLEERGYTIRSKMPSSQEKHGSQPGETRFAAKRPSGTGVKNTN